MKILFAASTKAHIVSFHLPYIARLSELGYEVTVAGSGTDVNIPGSHKSIDVPFEKKMLSFSNFKAALFLRRHIKAEKYRAIIVHTSLAAFFTRLAVLGMRKRPKLINMVHGYLFDDNSSLLKKMLYTLAEIITAPVTDLLITMNQSDLALAKSKRFAKNISFVPGVGVDVNRFKDIDIDKSSEREKLGIASDAFVIIYAAEFSPRKSQATLIKALSLLDKKAVLLLPGRGELLEECKVLSQELGVADRVVFPGFVSNMQHLYSLSDCACSSSRSEGLPFNIMEAMYMQKPIVASDVKGHSDLLDKDCLYAPDNTDAFVSLVKSALEKKTVEYDIRKYRLENVLAENMEIYRAILDKKQPIKNILIDLLN